MSDDESGPLAGAVLLAIAAVLVLALTMGIARTKGRDRRRILAEGVVGHGTVTAIDGPDRNGRCVVRFDVAPADSSRRFRVSQVTTPQAIESKHLTVGSSVPVRYLAKAPYGAFSEGLVIAERLASTPPPVRTPDAQPAVFFISYLDPAGSPFFISGRTASNPFRWYGSGDVTLGADGIRFAGRKARFFRSAAPFERVFAYPTIVDVEAFGNAVSLTLALPNEPARTLRFWTVDAAQANAIAAALPATKRSEFAPAMAEGAAFEARLKQLAPSTPVTSTLVAINCAVFVAAVIMGAGVFVPDPAVLVRLGSNYTPLTVGGQWWRLLTSTFLHFGILHVGFNMWALWVNGPLAERIFGPARYLLIYLSAGLAGSVVSLCWHPVVNGAGASGAIFGVFGALLAFFLRKEGGVPLSVVKRHRNVMAIFIGYNLLNGARFAGIDNAAHLGGLLAGFALGMLLTRPVDERRTSRDWNLQWLTTLCVVAVAAVAVVWGFESGQLHPRASLDEHGRVIPLAVLGEPLQSFSGVRLGWTAAEVVHAKGEPLSKGDKQWLYKVPKPGNDGELFVGVAESDGRRGVFAVMFEGSKDIAPPELPFLMGLTQPDLVARYGAPFFSKPNGPGVVTLAYRNGVVVNVEDGHVTAYGIVALAP